jgi:hypothetical protein
MCVRVLQMLFFIAIHGGLLMMMGQHARSESLFYTSAWKIRFLKTTYSVSLTDTSASISFVRS